jgi:hypothetical protein
MNMTPEDWYTIARDHRKIQKSIGNIGKGRTKQRLRGLLHTNEKRMSELSGDLDRIVQEQYPRNVLELPGFNGSYLNELFYITAKDDQTEIISNVPELNVFFQDYLNRVNHKVYNYAKNFNILKNNIPLLLLAAPTATWQEDSDKYDKEQK